MQRCGTWMPTTWHRFYDRTFFGEHHSVASSVPRRGGCGSPSPWIFRVSFVFKASNFKIRASSQPPTFLNETLAPLMILVVFLVFLRFEDFVYTLGRKEGMLASYKSVSTSDLASLASCRTWEGKKIPIFIIISSYFMLWIPLKECYWSFGQRWNLRLVCDHLLALFDGKSVKSGSPLFHS